MSVPPRHSAAFVALVNDAKQRIREVGIAEYDMRVGAGERVLLVDVREDHEWAQGNIPGAMHIGRGILERDTEHHGPDRSTPLVLYCGGGFRSALACDNLQKMGYTNVRSLEGGFRAWVARGMPVEEPEQYA